MLNIRHLFSFLLLFTCIPTHCVCFLRPAPSRAWEWGSTEAGSASSVSDPADVIEGWKSVCFGSAGQLGVGRVEEQPPRGTVEVYGHWGQPLWLGKGLGEPRPLNYVK